MRKSILAAWLAALAGTAAAQSLPYAPQEYDFGEIAEASLSGTVEQVISAAAPADPMVALLEHPVRPAGLLQVRLRLDDGRLLEFLQAAELAPLPGARLRLLPGVARQDGFQP